MPAPALVKPAVPARRLLMVATLLPPNVLTVTVGDAPLRVNVEVAGAPGLKIQPAALLVVVCQTGVAAGKHFGHRFYAAGVSDGHGYSATNLEYRVSRWLSLLGTISTVGQQGGNVRVSKDY